MKKCETLFKAEKAPGTFGLVCLGVLALAGCGSEGISSEWKRVPPGVAAEEFTLPQLNGTAVSLSDYRGRVVIMEFWATWCGPCRYSTPSLEVISKRHRDRGVTVLLINEGETLEAIRKWTAKRFTAPILLDEDGKVAGRYGIEGIPALFIVDQAGHLVYRHEGYGGGLERSLELILEELLLQHPSTHV